MALVDSKLTPRAEVAAGVEDIPSDIEQIRWFHSVPLLDGRVTEGRVRPVELEPLYLFDRLDFRGKSVMDIGCWDGYFSFMAERRGAERVLGLDDTAYRWGGMDGFNYLKSHFQSEVEWKRGSVYELPAEVFDIVLCYGVLYHINDPFTAATNCFQVARETVVFEGLIFEADAAMSLLLEPGEIANDNTNMYCLSTGFLDRVAKMNGFERQETFAAPSNVNNPSRDRHALMYRRVGMEQPGFSSYCFSHKPQCLQDA